MKNHLKHRRTFVALKSSCQGTYSGNNFVFFVSVASDFTVFSVSLGGAVLSVCVCLVCLCGSDKHVRRCVNMMASDNQAEPPLQKESHENKHNKKDRPLCASILLSVCEAMRCRDETSVSCLQRRRLVRAPGVFETLPLLYRWSASIQACVTSSMLGR